MSNNEALRRTLYGLWNFGATGAAPPMSDNEALRRILYAVDNQATIISGGSGILDLSNYTLTLPSTLTLQFRRGNLSELAGITLAAGEPGWTNDALDLFVGDGSTVGGLQIGLSRYTSSVSPPVFITGEKLPDIKLVNQTAGSTSLGGTQIMAAVFADQYRRMISIHPGILTTALPPALKYPFIDIQLGTAGTVSSTGLGGGGGTFSNQAVPAVAFFLGNGGNSTTSFNGGNGGSNQDSIANTFFRLGTGNGGNSGSGANGGNGGTIFRDFWIVTGNGGAGGSASSATGGSGGGTYFNNAVIEAIGGNGGDGGTSASANGGFGGSTGALILNGGNGASGTTTPGGNGGSGGVIDVRGGAASGSTNGGLGGNITTKASGVASGGSIDTSAPDTSHAGPSIKRGVGSPSGSVAGNPGDLYLNVSGGAGTTLYVHEDATPGSTVWVGK